MKPVSEAAVELAAESLWNEREYRDPSGGPPEDWCPPGHDVHQEPPREPDLWSRLAAAGEYPASLEETRNDARASLQAALPALRAQFRAELREQLMEQAGEYLRDADEADRRGEPAGALKLRTAAAVVEAVTRITLDDQEGG